MADEFGNGNALELPVGMDAVNRLIQENSELFSDKHCKVCSAVLISESQKLAHYQSKKHANKYRRYMSIHQGEDFSPAKKMKTDVTLPQEAPATTAADEGDRNKCCPVCNMTFSSPVVALSHYEGKTHAKNLKVKEQGGVPKVGVPQGAPRVAKPAPARVPPGNLDKSDPEKFCQLCSATFNNPQMAEQHYKGKKHQKQETKSKLMTIYTSTGTVPPKTSPLNPVTSGSGATGNWFSCYTCNVVLNSIEQYQAHISGLKHKTNLEATLPKYSDEYLPVPERKSSGTLFPSSFRSLEASSTTPGFSSSSAGFSSSSAGFSSSSAGFSPSSARFSSSSAGFSPSSTRFSSSSGGFSSSSPGFSSSSGGFSSSSPGFSSSSAGVSSSTGGQSSGFYSSMAGNFSSHPSRARSTAPSGGLLPRPSYAPPTQQPFLKDTIRPDGYNYYSQGY